MKKILSMFLLVVAACDITGAERVQLRLEGTVSAEATGQPISGARIVLYEDALIVGGNYRELAATTADSQGRFTLTHSAGRNCTELFFGMGLSASAQGFLTDAGGAVDCTETVQRVDFALGTIP